MMQSSPSMATLHHSPPKTDVHQLRLASPPPAYTTRGGNSHVHSLTPRRIRRNHSSRSNSPPSLLTGRGPIAATITSNPEQDQEGDSDLDEGTSPINLRINTSVNVSKNDNLVCLVETPADHANAIAQAVVQAIQENSSGQCGIPMIDEDGRPRPVRIEVDAGMVVEGSGNVIGSEDTIDQFLRRRSQLWRGRDDADGDDEGGEGSTSVKRRCIKRVQ